MASTAGIDAVPAPEAAGADESVGRGRMVLAWSLVGIATLLAVLAVLATWVNRQMLSDSSWETASTRLIQDPQVQAAVSNYVVTQIYENVDVAAEIRQALPAQLKPFAGPLAGALVKPSTQAVARLLTRPRVQKLWVDASVATHTRLVNVLENKTGKGIDAGNGTVTLDLRAIIASVAAQVGVPAAAVANLPPSVGVITVMRSDQLSTLQTAVQAIRILSVWLLVLALVLFGVALYLAHGKRREVLRTIGWSFIGVGLVALVARHVVGDSAVTSLVAEPNRVPAHRVWLISTSVLGDIGYAMILYGVFMVVGALLAGPSAAATRLRRWSAPLVVRHPAELWGGAVLLFLLLVLWGGTHALRTWWGVLLLGALAAVGILALQRQTAREFPALPAD